MTDPDSDAVRRAPAEVAASTPNADAVPPLPAATVVPLADRRRRDRMVLGGVAAAIVLVAAALAGVLAADGDGDGDESVEVADETTTSTEAESTTTTSTSPTSTSATTTPTSAVDTTVSSVPVTTAPPQPSGELLATGNGWEVRLDRGCVVVFDGDAEAGRECNRDQDAYLLAAPLHDDRTVHVAGSRRVTTADGFTNGGTLDETLQVVADSGTGIYVVSDSLPFAVLLREGSGGEWLAGIYDGRLVTDDAVFANPGVSAYQAATGSLSFGRFQEIGGYVGAGNRCVLARQVTPGPAIVADFCMAGDALTALLVPTEDPTLYDLFGIGIATNEWTCALPDGGSCGTGEVAGIAGFAGIIANRGPISVGDADEVVLSVDGSRESVVVPVPRDA